MFKEFKRVLGKTPTGLHVSEYFDLRRKRVSLMFLLIIAVTVLVFIPISFLVIQNAVAGIGACLIALMILVCMILVLKGRDRLGSALLLTFIAVIYVGILLQPALAQDEKYGAVLTSVVGLAFIIMMHAGIIVSATFVGGLGVFFALGVCRT